MTPPKIFVLWLVAILPIAGCRSSTSPQQPAPITAGPSSQSPGSDAQREETERKKRDADTKRRRGNSTDIDKTDAYRKYVP